MTVMLMVQLPPALTLGRQSSVSEKPALATMLATARAHPPVLLSVTGIEALGVPTIICDAKVRLVVGREAVGTAPVPLKLTVCGLLLALSVMVRVALREPTAAGVKVTVIVQFPPETTLAPQVFVWPKSPMFVPVMAMLEMASVAVPVLLRVTD